MDAFINLDPILESIPIAFDTSVTLAPVSSHNSEIALIDDTRCAKKALAVNFDNSRGPQICSQYFFLGNPTSIHLS